MSIYKNFVETKKYSEEIQSCIKSTVESLLNKPTNVNHPGMLLGKIQSGKTRTFIGIIAYAFDHGYSICIVFTKGTKVLAEQTYQRLDAEFLDFITQDEVKVYDIMNRPSFFTPFILRQKLIIVVKKETNNLDNLVKFLETYPELQDKRTLIIDDEADFASVGFRKDKNAPDGISINVLAAKIDSIKVKFGNHYDFLQVTATPYSLYLQPRDEFELNEVIYQPIKPAFTSIVPIHEKYIGGQQYFEESLDPESPFSHLHIQVPDEELKVLIKRDGRYLTNILSTHKLSVFRNAIVNYIVGGSIRIIQNKAKGLKFKSSFIIHTATGKTQHQWQLELANALLQGLKDHAYNDEQVLRGLVEESYNNFSPSISKNHDHIPPFDQVFAMVKESLKDGLIGVIKINSENEIAASLDRNGQLRLDNPFNIFVGGQMLDRGITIENLIGFFYGRNPSAFQQDTVLQHSRMYGARSMEDMAVTRLYTSNRIYQAMQTMHSFDSSLRDAFLRGLHNQDDGVVFVERDKSGNIKPCAPSKILITATETVGPHKRFLPVGFQTKSYSKIHTNVTQIDKLVEVGNKGNFNSPFLLEMGVALQIIDLIASTFEYKEHHKNLGYEWDVKTFKAIIRRLVHYDTNPALENKIYCYAQKDREMARWKNNETDFANAPDNSRTDTTIAKNIAKETPCLILLKQTGKEKPGGWRDAQFWWPILVTPENAKTAVFATEILS